MSVEMSRMPFLYILYIILAVRYFFLFIFTYLSSEFSLTFVVCFFLLGSLILSILCFFFCLNKLLMTYRSTTSFLGNFFTGFKFWLYFSKGFSSQKIDFFFLYFEGESKMSIRHVRFDLNFLFYFIFFCLF